MATLVVKTTSLTGLNPLAVAYVACASGGDVAPNDGNTILHVKNLTDQESTVIVDSVVACNQGSDHNVSVVVPVSSERMIGPFPRGRFNNASAQIAITYTGGVTNLTIAAISLGV